MVEGLSFGKQFYLPMLVRLLRLSLSIGEGKVEAKSSEFSAVSRHRE
jgi:hypothetical protein